MNQLRFKTQRMIILVSFLTVPLILLAAFTYYPALRLIYMSFTNWDGVSSSHGFIGFSNYKEIFVNPDIFGVLRHNLYYFAGGIVQNALALYFAVLLNTQIKGRNLFRVILFLPYILNSVATAYMFKFIFDTDHGTLNTVLALIGLGAWQQSWLGDQQLVNISLAGVSLWKYMGFNMVIYLGVLQSIPGDLYEAGKIDGANAFQSFRYITLPNIRKIIELNMLLTVSGALEVFDIPYIITLAAPGSDTFVTKVNDVAFKFNNYGLASAMSIVLLFIVIAVITIQRKLILRGED